MFTRPGKHEGKQRAIPSAEVEHRANYWHVLNTSCWPARNRNLSDLGAPSCRDMKQLLYIYINICWLNLDHCSAKEFGAGIVAETRRGITFFAGIFWGKPGWRVGKPAEIELFFGGAATIRTLRQRIDGICKLIQSLHIQWLHPLPQPVTACADDLS